MYAIRSYYVLLLDIYGSAREVKGDVTSTDLAEHINRYTPEKAANVTTVEKAVELLRGSADSGDVIISMGAGNVVITSYSIHYTKLYDSLSINGCMARISSE